MKQALKQILFLSLLSVAAVPAFSGQTLLTDLEKAKSIKLLQATRKEIANVFQADTVFYSDDFLSREATRIHVDYSSGKCTTNGAFSVNSDDWNVSEGTVTKIYISPKNRLTINQIGIDYSRFKKEKLYRGIRGHHVYHDKKAGIAITVTGEIVESITLFPSGGSRNPLLCSNPEIRRYYVHNRWRRNPQPKYACVLGNFPADVVDLALDPSRESLAEFYITTRAEDAENDVLTYNYKISAGKIVGSGPKVIWDLTGVTPGIYKITAAVDDGCGLCGKFVTKTVAIK